VTGVLNAASKLLPLPLLFQILQEILGAHDRRASGASEPQQILIGGNDEVRPGLRGAFEDAIVGFVFLYYIQGLSGRDKCSEPQNLVPGGMEPIAIPLKLVSQNPYHLVNDRLGHGNLNVAVNCHVQEPHASELEGRHVDISRVTLALGATVLTPGFCDQAGDIGFRVAQPARLLTPILAKVVQLAVRQISPQGVRRDLVRGFALRTRGFIHRAQQFVRDTEVVLGCHAFFISQRTATGASLGVHSTSQSFKTSIRTVGSSK